MFRLALHKMRQNRWLALSLLVGYLMAVAIICSMPLYSHAILNRMLLKDMEQIQITRNLYPGRLCSSTTYYTGRDPIERFQKYDRMYHEAVLKDLGLPVQNVVTQKSLKSMRIVRPGDMDYDSLMESYPSGKIGAVDNLYDHIQLVEGKFPSAKLEDGVIEVMLNQRASYILKLSYGATYDVYDYNKKFVKIGSVKVVGIYEQKDPSDLYWTFPWAYLEEALVMDPGLFDELFMSPESTTLIGYSSWTSAVDYKSITPENCGKIAETLKKYGDKGNFIAGLYSPLPDILEEYDARRTELISTLWIIQIPIMLMLFFYIMMVSRLILDHEKNEIAMLKSRGASNFQILLLYFWQSLVLAGFSFFAGPLLSILFCRVIGASNGFMEFVNRKALEVDFMPNTIVYALVTAGVLILTMLLAVLFSSETSIVAFKRKKSGKSPTPLWQKLCLDLVCLAISGYALYNFQNRLQILRQTGAAAAEIPIDFMMYGSSTLFILGVSLLFLRIFPLLVRLIYKIGERGWGPVLYLSLLNTSRGSRRNQTISLFLIFTLSMGVFNSVMVRTLNQNDEDRIRYTNGADIVLQEKWPSTGGIAADPSGMGMGDMEITPEANGPVCYSEPRFARFQEMKTVESAARVLKKEGIELSGESQRTSGITLMGIVPDEFGKTCWMKNSLLPHHLNEYLNLLADEPRALLLSQNLMDELTLESGDTVLLSIGKNKNMVQFVVYAGIEYFPTFISIEGTKKAPTLAVANLIYLQQETKLEPYQVWLKKAPGVTSAQVYQELEEKDVAVDTLTDATQQLIKVKNDSMTQGINGFFTLSFLITMLIAFAGFFIYWILTIKGRFLQFGILRSMGLSRLSVVMVLLWEQLLVSVTAIAAGFGTGSLAAILFAPILECNVDASEQVLPFMVATSPVDYWRIILLVSIMMLAAAVILGRIIFRLHAGEALKLGED